MKTTTNEKKVETPGFSGPTPSSLFLGPSQLEPGGFASDLIKTMEEVAEKEVGPTWLDIASEGLIFGLHWLVTLLVILFTPLLRAKDWLEKAFCVCHDDCWYGQCGGSCRHQSPGVNRLYGRIHFRAFCKGYSSYDIPAEPKFNKPS